MLLQGSRVLLTRNNRRASRMIKIDGWNGYTVKDEDKDRQALVRGGTYLVEERSH